MLPNKILQSFRRQLHGLGTPMGIGHEILDLTVFCFRFHQDGRRIEDKNAFAFHFLLEALIGGILQLRLPPPYARGQLFRVNHGLDRRRHDDQRYPPPGELLLQVKDRRPRIRLYGRGPFTDSCCALLQLDRMEKGRPRQIIDSGPVKEPGRHTAVGFLIARAEPCRQDILDLGTNPFPDDGLVVQGLFKSFHLLQKMAVHGKNTGKDAG